MKSTQSTASPAVTMAVSNIDSIDNGRDGAHEIE